MSTATWVDPNGKKTFVPLENNPQVMTNLVRRLGVSPLVGFYDIYAIDDEDLLGFIPRPAYALILIVPGTVFPSARDSENEAMAEYEGAGPDEPVLWFRQTIGHSCGLMALIHSVVNGGCKAYVEPGSLIDKLSQAAIPLKPKERAEVLYNSAELEAAHQECAQQGDSVPPLASEDNEFHFISFVKGDDNHLWELNGGMKGPVDRGVLEPEHDVLSQEALDLGIRSFIRAAKENGLDDMRYSIVALAPSME